MAKIKGSLTTVKVSPDNITYTAVGETNDISMSIQGNTVEVSTFGDVWVSRMQTLKDATYSSSGFFDPSNTLGQVAVLNALINDTTLYLEILFDGTNGYRHPVTVASFEISSEVDGVVEYSVEYESAGSVVAVP